MYRLLAIDLDGTLLSPKKLITARTYHALHKAIEAGMILVVATGQTLNVLRAVCANLPLTAPQIIYNGAIIVDLVNNTVLNEQLVPSEHILPTLATLRTFNLYRAYHTHQYVYVDQNTPDARNWYRPPVPPAIEIPDVASLYPSPCIKLAAVGNPMTLRHTRGELETLFANQLSVVQSSRNLLEFMHPTVSKGNALRTIAHLLGIDLQDVVAFGDQQNDIGMLRSAGLGVAMGNAHEEVKAAADYVTLSNAEEGVAAALETLILPQFR